MTISEGFSPGYVEQQEALIADLRRMLNESAAVHADLKESMIKMVADVAIWRTRAERAEAALAAVPWQALLNIYECITLPAVALDGDVNTLAAFLNQYAPWAAASDCVESEVKP